MRSDNLCSGAHHIRTTVNHFRSDCSYVHRFEKTTNVAKVHQRSIFNHGISFIFMNRTGISIIFMKSEPKSIAYLNKLKLIQVDKFCTYLPIVTKSEQMCIDSDQIESERIEFHEIEAKEHRFEFNWGQMHQIWAHCVCAHVYSTGHCTKSEPLRIKFETSKQQFEFDVFERNILIARISIESKVTIRI